MPACLRRILPYGFWDRLVRSTLFSFSSHAIYCLRVLLTCWIGNNAVSHLRDSNQHRKT